MDFFNGQTLLNLCKKEQISISAAMKEREITMGTLSSEEVDKKLAEVLTIMKNSARQTDTDSGKIYRRSYRRRGKAGCRPCKNKYKHMWFYAV